MRREKPAISVIIPTYNRASTIKRSVESVLNQTFQDFEIVIVDDGSTDETEQTVAELESDRIKYIKLNQNCGISAARNRGIKEAAADLIIFQDSDDEYLPEKLELHKKAFDESPQEVGVIYSGFWYYTGDKRIYRPNDRNIPVQEGDVYKELLKGCILPIQSMVRKSLLLEINGFDERMKCSEDWDLWIRLAKISRFVYLRKALHKVYFTPDSINANSVKFIEARKFLIQKHFDDIKADRRILSLHYHLLADMLLSADKQKEALEYRKKAYSANPKNIKYLLGYILSKMGPGFYLTAQRILTALKKGTNY